ncbi:hypothetical protein F5Y05DRAFT_417704 [Hypoxylon sp. FL0543]|nr:hypothetical protein F5Y05DRAFT_417704 [Hypoxylon sp. FL0543]
MLSSLVSNADAEVLRRRHHSSGDSNPCLSRVQAFFVNYQLRRAFYFSSAGSKVLIRTIVRGRRTEFVNQRYIQKLPGANLTNEETIYMMDLCPSNTVAGYRSKLSKFCRLFTVDELEKEKRYA